MGKNAKRKIEKSSSKILREFSSGGVVYRKIRPTKSKSQEVEWLVRATSPSKLFPKIRWGLPKGWLDDSKPGVPGPMASGKIRASEKDLQKTASREVKEETGVKAKIVAKIGSTRYFYRHPVRGMILKFVTFYLMEWLSDLPGGFDSETSEVVWLPFEKAYKKISSSGEKKVLKKGRSLLGF